MKIGLIIALMIGFSLQFFAAVEMTQPTINHFYSNKWKRLATEALVRLSLLAISSKLIKVNQIKVNVIIIKNLSN